MAADGTVTVDIRAEVTPDVLERIASVGGIVVNAVPAYGAIRAHVPLDGLETIAESSEVQFIRQADRMTTHQQSAAEVDRYAPQGIRTQKVNTSEGDLAHRAARAFYNVTGAGVGIGVLSSGVDSLAARQASGDLPAVTVLSGQAGTGDKGTAMLEWT